MTAHNPQEFATDLGAKLATRSRHVCIFLGAGAARACGLPDVKGLEDIVKKSLEDPQRSAFEQLLKDWNIEQVLSRLRVIAGLATDTEKFGTFGKSDAEKLDKDICQAIVKALAIENASLAPMEHFAAWIGRANYRSPIEIFGSSGISGVRGG